MAEKPWLSYDDQLSLLRRRGLIVSDPDEALSWLKRCGYYRLSGYLFPFRNEGSDGFLKGASFEHLKQLYAFDQQLRILSLEAIEKIEVSIRAIIAYKLGKIDPLAYSNMNIILPKYLPPSSEDWINWQQKNMRNIKKSKEECILHYKKNYEAIPIWVCCQVWDFGSTSYLYKMLRLAHQNEIASELGLIEGKDFSTWLSTINYYRNLCAHQQRLWNANLLSQPGFERVKSNEEWCKGLTPHQQGRCFIALCIIYRILVKLFPDYSWGNRVKELFLNFPDFSDLENYRGRLTIENSGFEDDWEERWRQIKENPR